MKEALFYQKLDQNKVKCNLCNHRCLILENHRGLCGVRENRKGILYSLVYGKLIAQHIDPIEKKPLYHFLPASLSYSIATVGCNLRCQHCQNADISQVSKEGFFYDRSKIPGEDVSPEQVVRQALDQNCRSISYTYTEPTIFCEFALDCMKEARSQGLKNNWVTNGYITQEALKEVAPYLDAANVDLKFFKDKSYQTICGARLKAVLDTLRSIKKLGIWLEVTTLVIPTLNDGEEELRQIAHFLKNDLGAETPWHVSAFYPAYKLINVPQTSTKTILKAVDIGRKSGLKYVYGGNIIDNEAGTTYCSKCNKVVIRRFAYQTTRLDKNGKCVHCGEKIDGVF